jgi:hypothetical protein
MFPCLDIKTALPLALLCSLVLVAGCEPLNTRKDKDDSTQSETPSERDQPRGISLENIQTDMPTLDALSNLGTIMFQQNLNSYHRQGFHGQGLKIAVLDNGFSQVSQSIGTRLPPDTTIIEGNGNPMADSIHGTKLAEMVYALATGSTTYDASKPGPQMYLYNTNGYSNLVRSIDHLIQEEVDMVLYAQVWEYGGNFDGKGFINQKITSAIASGVLWVNAAGNQGQSTWSGPIKIDQNRDVALPYKAYADSRHSFLRFTVPMDQTDVKIVLAWNDFTDDKEYMTPQDLDLFLYDDKNQIIGQSELIQSGKEQEGEGFSSHAREIIRGPLNAGTYKLRAVARSYNFDEKSRLRLSLGGEGVRVLEKTQESLSQQNPLIPADNHGVLAVGALDVDYSNQGARKPEVSVRSRVQFGPNFVRYGTSSASAIAAGTLAVYQSKHGPLTKIQIDNLLHSGALPEDLRLP